MMRRLAIGFAATLLCGAGVALAQAPPPPPPAAPPPALEYGPTITLDQAKRVIAVAEAEAARRKVALAFAIAEPNGEIIFMEHMTGAHYASTDNAEDRARSAARWRRPTDFWNTSTRTWSPCSRSQPEPAASRSWPEAR